MKITGLLLALLITLPATASAESGQQADFTTLIEFGDAVNSLGAALSSETRAGSTGAETTSSAPVRLTGQLFWTDEFIRLDYDPADGMHESTLVDIENQVTYKLDHLTHTATRIELAGWSAKLASGFDLPDPEALAADWEGFLLSVKQIDGAVVNQLAPRAVNGYQCTGVSFVVESPARAEATPTGEDAEMSEMISAMMSAMGGYSGEVWVTEGVSMPISMTLNTMLLNYALDISNVAPVTFKMSKFMVPPGYKVVELELPDIEQLLEQQ